MNRYPNLVLQKFNYAGFGIDFKKRIINPLRHIYKAWHSNANSNDLIAGDRCVVDKQVKPVCQQPKRIGVLWQWQADLFSVDNITVLHIDDPEAGNQLV